MLSIVTTKRFEKDLKKAIKQKKKLEQLKVTIDQLVTNQRLAASYKDHALTGNFKGFRECHIAPDWLLIYKKDSDYLYLARTGSHSELFNK